jgi:hypothetical protein
MNVIRMVTLFYLKDWHRIILNSTNTNPNSTTTTTITSGSGTTTTTTNYNTMDPTTATEDKTTSALMKNDPTKND